MAGICISLTDETTAAIVDRMAKHAQDADLFEIRGDRVRDLDLAAILRARTIPLVFTCRAASQGGGVADDDPSRRETLLEAVSQGFDYVDVECTSGFADVMEKKAGKGLIVSHHDLEGTPFDLDGLYRTMRGFGADIVKIAVTPRSIADVGRLLAFASRVALGDGPPLIAIAMGPIGILTRILGGRTGAPFTYACPEPGAEAAPGQLSAASLAKLYRVREITSKTRVYGILGREVLGSLSPAIHNRAFAAKGIDAVYVHLQAESLEAFLEALPNLGLSGFSVTRPYKVDIVEHLVAMTEDAASAGSVNTVVVREDGLHGSSTDGRGVVTPLEVFGELSGLDVAILGAGGASRAAAAAIMRRGGRVAILARDPEKATKVAKALQCGSADIRAFAAGTWDVVLNATPVGSRSLGDGLPIPAESLRPEMTVFDMVYDPLETPLLRAACEKGCTTIDGLRMLVAQAVGQFEAWTGEAAPAEVMEAAARSAAAGRPV